MGNGNNEKLGKEFVKQYGKETVFSYGCDPKGEREVCACDDQGPYKTVIGGPISDIYVYRMTMTTEDGDVVEYTPDFMRYRCEQMGIKCVPVFEKFIIPEQVDAGEYVKDIAEKYYAGPDPVGKTHTREGVVVRIVNRPKFAAVKHKNFEFKVLEGIISEKLAESTADIAEDVLAEM
jgi:hypothetical protein